MANISTNDSGWDKLPVYIVWSGEFLTIGTGNLLVALTILWFTALRNRKEYLIICGLCITDFLYLGSFFSAAMYRSSLLVAESHSSMIPFWQCFNKPFTIGWLVSMHLSPLMLLVVSTDRLLSVIISIQYLSFTASYAKRLLGCVYGYCIVVSMCTVALAVVNEQRGVHLAAPCYFAEVMLPVERTLAMYLLYNGPVWAALSIVLYIILGVVYWRKKNKVADSQQHLQLLEHQRQRRLTKSLGISCICTFGFFVMPVLLTWTGEFLGWSRLTMQWLWVLPNINPGCNIIIYLKRQEELREGIWAMLTHKTMPLDVKAWKANILANQHQKMLLRTQTGSSRRLAISAKVTNTNQAV